MVDVVILYEDCNLWFVVIAFFLNYFLTFWMLSKPTRVIIILIEQWKILPIHLMIHLLVHIEYSSIIQQRYNYL